MIENNRVKWMTVEDTRHRQVYCAYDITLSVHLTSTLQLITSVCTTSFLIITGNRGWIGVLKVSYFIVSGLISSLSSMCLRLLLATLAPSLRCWQLWNLRGHAIWSFVICMVSLADSKFWQVGRKDENSDDDWEYVEEGPPEIIWQGNEIIVKKKKVRVKKKDTDHQIKKEVLLHDYGVQMLILWIKYGIYRKWQGLEHWDHKAKFVGSK